MLKRNEFAAYIMGSLYIVGENMNMGMGEFKGCDL